MPKAVIPSGWRRTSVFGWFADQQLSAASSYFRTFSQRNYAIDNDFAAGHAHMTIVTGIQSLSANEINLHSPAVAIFKIVPKLGSFDV